MVPGPIVLTGNEFVVPVTSSNLDRAHLTNKGVFEGFLYKLEFTVLFE